LYRKILFGLTEHPITVWAGVILLRLYFEWINLRKELNESLEGFAKRSNNQISSVDVMLSWYYGLALGAERFCTGAFHNFAAQGSGRSSCLISGSFTLALS